MLTTEQARQILNVTPEQLDEMAKPYEEGTFEPEGGEIFIGSHLDRVGKKRVTVIYDATDTQQVNKLAKKQGVKPSYIYRNALKSFLAKQTTTA